MTTLLEQIAAGPLDGSVWNLGPAVVVGEVLSASVQCLSVLPHPQMLNGRLRCGVDHDELGTSVHGAMVGPHHVTWTTAEAAKAWASVNRCLNTYCGAVVADGVTYCSAWCRLADKHDPADDYEPDEVA
jgi:hypothetical protein